MCQDVIDLDHRADNTVEATMLHCLGQADPKNLQQSTNFIGQINRLVEQGLASAEQCTIAVASRLFMCTGLNHPAFGTWAIPRASFLSVLLRIADSAAFTWRASMHTASKPSLVRPKKRCWLIVPASKPTRSIGCEKARRHSAISTTHKAARAQEAPFLCYRQDTARTTTEIRPIQQNIPSSISLVHSYPVILS
jgi:hypothetical protein